MSHMYIVAYNDMFRSDSTIFRSLRAMIMQHIRQSARWDPIYIVRCSSLFIVARMGQGRGVHRVLVGKPEGKRPLGRPRRRWEDNIKMDLREVGGGCEDWMELAQDRDRWRALVSTVMSLRVPKMRGIS